MDTKDKGCCSKFSLEYEELRWFVNSQWPHIPQTLYLLWRLLAFAFCVTLFVSLLRTPYSDTLWPIYLTYWSFITLFAYTFCHLGIVAYSYYQRWSTGQGTPDVMPWYYKLTWLLYIIGSNSGLCVTFLWTVQYQSHQHLTLLSIGTHALNTVYILLDLCITGMPVRIQHCVYGLVFGVIYSLFNLIYMSAGGVDIDGKHYYIYKLISWENKTTSLVWTVLFLDLSLLLWIILYALVHLRLYIHSKYCKNRRTLLEQARESVRIGEYQRM